MNTSWLLLERVRDKLCPTFDLAARSVNLNTATQLHLVVLLHEQDGQRASDLARGVGYPPTSFTSVLDNLESMGIVRREPDARDRRAVRFFLTPAGKLRAAAAFDALVGAQEAALLALCEVIRWPEVIVLRAAMMDCVSNGINGVGNGIK